MPERRNLLVVMALASMSVLLAIAALTQLLARTGPSSASDVEETATQSSVPSTVPKATTTTTTSGTTTSRPASTTTRASASRPASTTTQASASDVSTLRAGVVLGPSDEIVAVGALDVGDVDLVEIELPVGTQVIIEMVAEDPTALDTLLVVTSPSGAHFENDDHGGSGSGDLEWLDSRIELVSPVPGLYLVEAGSFSGSGSYELRISTGDDVRVIAGEELLAADITRLVQASTVAHRCGFWADCQSFDFADSWACRAGVSCSWGGFDPLQYSDGAWRSFGAWADTDCGGQPYDYGVTLVVEKAVEIGGVITATEARATLDVGRTCGVSPPMSADAELRAPGTS